MINPNSDRDKVNKYCGLDISGQMEYKVKDMS